MVFEELRYREPVRLQRPDRDRRYACLSYHVPATQDLPIFLDHGAADAIERHALSDTSVELGGILLGKECVDETTGAPFVWVTQSLEAKHYANTQASFTYTHDSWEEITRERDRLFPDLDIVGWYHTHPSFGIFLSHHDLFIHQHFFAQPLQVAYVVDPIQQSRGFFQWRDRSMAQVEGFYLIADRGDRIALARVANDLENFPSPQGAGGGGLSPRLEAELIKMLTRPASSSYAGSPADRAQLALVFALLGSALGALCVIAALWMYQLHAQLEEQGDALRALAHSVEQSAGTQHLAMDTLLEKVGTESPAQFAERYERAARARDEARKQLLSQQAINETLGARTRELEKQASDLSKDLKEAREKLADSAEDAKAAPSLREKLARLQGELEEKSALADAVDSEKGAQLLRKLNIYQYATYFLAGISLLLGGLLAWPHLRVETEPQAEHPSAIEPGPHRIN
jgi:proteasome lid subunit RPN8/RPN11